MTYSDLRSLTQPFRPFRIKTTTGQVYDVWQREGFILANWHIVIGLLKSGTDEYERTVFLDFDHIEHLEFLPQTAPVKGIGQPGG